ncbi:MAG: M81 family metallopeptidase [Alphaproteobacteria bacterium]|nr:M81 family metallopeptidase [Alphaproteobacteria bacterium]
MAKIAVGGFQHETNTFAPAKAGWQAFVDGGGWPTAQKGAGILDDFVDLNIPLSGAIARLKALGHQVVPLAYGNASPSNVVTAEAYERISDWTIAELKAHGPFDGVYLDIHGAMVAEHHDDGEGEFLARVRKMVGGIPLTTSLDLHSNTTPEMLDRAEGMVAYKTYPHVDMAATGARAAEHLDGLLKGSRADKRAIRHLPFLIPLTWQCSLVEPSKSIYAGLDKLEGPGVSMVSFSPGFPAADFGMCGPAVFAYGSNQAAVDRAADHLAEQVANAEMRFAGRLYSPEDAVREARAIAARADKPVVLADTQDNPGAGGASDTMGLLRAMVAAGAEATAIGLIVDPETARKAQLAGEGKTVKLALGGKSRIPGDAPLEADFVVEKVTDGNLIGTGPMMKNAKVRLGPSACLKIGGVRIAVSSTKVQMLDLALFRHYGIEPTRQKILGVKSSVHFRADFQPIAADVLVVEAPGPMIVDPAKLPWKKLRRGVRMCPGGPIFSG